MQAVNIVIILLTTVIVITQCQQSIGDLCTIQSSNAEGVCKLLADCKQAIDDLQNNGIFPQTCGFQGTAPIVCCKNVKQPPVVTRRAGEISSQKCREYSKYRIEKIKPPILLPNTPFIEKDLCGHKVVKLIIGGTPAERREFPHMATIGYEITPGDVKWLCGGTIISEQYILTAAHCLESSEFGLAKYVRMGVTDLNDKSIRRQDFTIIERIPHPNFRISTHYDDIALIKLEKPAKLDPYSRPACLYTKKEITAEQAIATGWGSTAYAGLTSDQLLKVTLDFFDQPSCNYSYRNQIKKKLKRGIVGDTQICAGSKTDEDKDTCQGDSGGPLQIYHIDDDIKCMYDIVGITSFGKACSGSPGVYTRVSYYIKWIEDIVWPPTP